MPDHLTKAEILERLQTEYEQLQAVVGSLTDEEIIMPNTFGTWSVKDIIAHLIFWNENPMREIQGAMRGERHYLDYSPGIDAINEEVVAPYRLQSFDMVNIAFADSVRSLVELLDSLPEEAYAPESVLQELLEESMTDTLADNTFEHYAEHREDIEAWIRSRRNA